MAPGGPRQRWLLVHRRARSACSRVDSLAPVEQGRCSADGCHPGRTSAQCAKASAGRGRAKARVALAVRAGLEAPPQTGVPKGLVDPKARERVKAARARRPARAKPLPPVEAKEVFRGTPRASLPPEALSASFGGSFRRRSRTTAPRCTCLPLARAPPAQPPSPRPSRPRQPRAKARRRVPVRPRAKVPAQWARRRPPERARARRPTTRGQCPHGQGCCTRISATPVTGRCSSPGMSCTAQCAVP